MPKYRVPIRTVLMRWAEDDEQLAAMARAAQQERRGGTMEDCRADILRRIFWGGRSAMTIWSTTISMRSTQQVRRYTRAATQKIENLTSREQNVRGDLDAVLTALSHSRRADGLTDRLRPVFQLYEQSYLSEKSLRQPETPGQSGREPLRC